MVDDLALSGSEGLLADEDPVDRRAPLDARGGVDHVTGDHGLTLTRRSVERDESLAGVDSDPDMEIAAGLVVVQARDGIPHRERRPHRALRVVLVGDRRTEDRDDGVADELLDGAAVGFESISRMLVVHT